MSKMFCMEVYIKRKNMLMQNHLIIIYIYIYVYIHIYIYIYICIYTDLPVSDIVRLAHPRSEDSQGQEMFLALSADKQTHNYDTECSNHHPSLSTLRSKGLSRSKVKWWAIIYTAVHHVPKCMSCHKTIVVITSRVHCFHDCMYIYVYMNICS